MQGKQPGLLSKAQSFNKPSRGCYGMTENEREGRHGTWCGQGHSLMKFDKMGPKPLRHPLKKSIQINFQVLPTDKCISMCRIV